MNVEYSKTVIFFGQTRSQYDPPWIPRAQSTDDEDIRMTFLTARELALPGPTLPSTVKFPRFML
jgi:hypothetical protein